METITLNDGTVVNGHILPSGDEQTIFVYLNDMTVYQGVVLFGDSNKSSILIENNHGTENTYEGYTDLFAASHEFGNCNLVMRRT